MKKGFIFLVLVLLIWAISGDFSYGDHSEMGDAFPELAGWQKEGVPDIYTPDNLFEYINGAAEVYLGYSFEKLATLTYKNKKNQSLTVDIYRHKNQNNGFGIYSQEKPAIGEFLTIGTQGYYEKGVLNFFKGCFYVKMTCFDIEDNDKLLLTSTANRIANRLMAKEHFPLPVLCLPAKSKKKNSEKYIAKNFLGHGFLHSAFIADYQNDGESFQIFIIEADNKVTAKEMIENYLDLVKKKGLEISENNGRLEFTDPYYRSQGKMNLKLSGKFVWGLFSKSIETAAIYISEIEKNLKKYRLI